MENQVCVTGILDIGIGNVASVANAVSRLGGTPNIISKKGEIGKCARLIIPGVGTFGAAMRAISPYREEMLEFAKSGKPVLGICLGMQIMLERGFENGEFKGLELFKGSVRKMNFAPKLPHVGWARIGSSMAGKDSREGGTTGSICRAGKMENNDRAGCWNGGILEGLEQGEYMYFVHSYACFLEENGAVRATCDYGKEFTACISRGNVWGVQFHPEKSGKAGARIIDNFLKL